MYQIPERSGKRFKSEIIKEIVEHYGVAHQEEKAIEEMSELTKELIKKRHSKDRYEGIQIVRNVREEIADVYVMIRQLMLMYDEELIMDIAAQKLMRTKEEMENESGGSDRKTD